MKCLNILAVLTMSLLAMQVKADPAVVPLHLEKMKALKLESIPPWPDELILKGTNQHWQKELHRGGNSTPSRNQFLKSRCSPAHYKRNRNRSPH